MRVIDSSVSSAGGRAPGAVLSRDASAKAAIMQGVRAEQADMLYRSPVAMMINLVAAPAVVMLVGSFYPAWLLAAWLLAFYLVTGVRFLGWRAYRRAPHPTESAERWLRRYALGALVAGCLWGLAASLVFLVDDPAYYVDVGLAVMIMTAVVIAAYSVHLPTFSALALPAVLPAIAALLWRGTTVSIGMALATVVIIVVLAVVGRDLNRALTETFRLKAEKAALVRELAAGRDAAETESRAKSEFLAHLSHELRTPLNAIIGFSDMFTSERYGPMPSPEYLDHGRYINEAAQHLLEVVKRVLDMLKAEAGALLIEEDVVDLDGVIDMSVRMVSEQAKAAGLALERAVSPGLPAIRGDAGRLRQVLLNLLSNAIKFTAPGGRIRISAASDATGATVISVADSGVGMRAEDIPRALTPFVQLDSRPGMRAEGAGLGLPLAKRLVELHGGKFEIESAPGAGTKITIRLPPERALAASDAAAQGDSAAEAAAGGKTAGGT